MINQLQLTQASQVLLDNNIRILQGYRFGHTDREHVRKLLWYMNPGKNTTWLDIGCGFGEVAKLMQEQRPDLHFTLVNNNVFQLAQAPIGMPTHLCDMHRLPFKGYRFDGAMFLYSLCHADPIEIALDEAGRAVDPKLGRLFVFDYLRTGGDNVLSQKFLYSEFPTYEELMYVTRGTGWVIDEFRINPAGSDAVFRAVFEDQTLYDDIFRDLTPVIWTASRRAGA